MAVETYPCFLQDEQYSAESLRHVFGTLLARGANIGSIAGGLVGSTDMRVAAGSGMQVTVAAGEAWINGTSNSVQGGYLGRVTSSTALAISAASESNPRIDTIIAQVTDKSVAGGVDSFSVSVVTGTATSGATLGNKSGVGAVPASSLVLAYVLVPLKAVSIVSGDIENVAKYAVAGFGGVRQEAGTTSFLSWGVVEEDGALVAGSEDYTVARVGEHFVITWAKEKASANYAVVATPASNSVFCGVVLAEADAVVYITNYKGEAAPFGFTFIAVASH